MIIDEAELAAGMQEEEVIEVKHKRDTIVWMNDRPYAIICLNFYWNILDSYYLLHSFSYNITYLVLKGAWVSLSSILSRTHRIPSELRS